MSRPRILRLVPYALAGAVWMGLAYIMLFGADPRGPCADYVYRDPVTGRTGLQGPAYVKADGRISCPR